MSSNKGHLTIILGCMFSGKSSELIRRYKRFKSINKNVLLINHTNDNRYGKNIVSSHDKIKVKSLNLSNLMDLIKDNNQSYLQCDVIMIEESQFFSDLFEFVTTSVDINNKEVVIAGLDGDFLRKPFGHILKCIPLSDNVIKLKSMCTICRDGTFGIFSKRIINNDSKILVGNNKQYIATCRKHYLN